MKAPASPEKPKLKTHEAPRISLNKLAEYIYSLPVRQTEILQNAKHPSTFITKQYEEACQTAVAYFVQGRDAEVVLRKIAEVEARTPEKEFARQQRDRCAEALQQFAAYCDAIPLPADAQLLAGSSRQLDSLTLGGTLISLRPDLLIRYQTARKVPAVGVIKLVFSKTHPLKPEAAQLIGALLRYQLTAHYPAPTKVPAVGCFVYDVFAQTVYHAPEAHIKRVREAEAAGKLIANLWPSIAKPKGWSAADAP